MCLVGGHIAGNHFNTHYDNISALLIQSFEYYSLTNSICEFEIYSALRRLLLVYTFLIPPRRVILQLPLMKLKALL
jgi:hypothetical protein